MQNKTYGDGMIEAPVETGKIRKVYDLYSNIYFLAAPIEKKARMRGIELAQIAPDDKILEVAVGIGHSFVEILKRVGSGNIVHGIDISPKMLEKTRKAATGSGYANFNLKEGDARRLPFPGETFDVVYNSYMLDLMPLADLPVVLNEFKRVLKKGGRIVLVNFSKKDAKPTSYEKLYGLSPYFWGGCRPVMMESLVRGAGFKNVRREVPKMMLPSEIVTALK